MRIVYWARLPLAKARIIEHLGAVPGVELVVADSLPELLQAMPGAEGLVLYNAPQSEAQQVIEALRAPGNQVRWLHFASAGREGFEAVGFPPGIAVTYAAGGVAPVVAEHAMALLLSLGRRIPEALAQQAQSRFQTQPLAGRAWSLEGRTMAIIGSGHIGKEIAQRARAFGARTVGLSRAARPDALFDESRPLSQLNEVLAAADCIMVAIALAPETRHLVGAEALAACRPGALIVNVARGPVVDQLALGEALRSGKLGGAGLDVTDPEPLPAEDPLWSCPNLIVTPHYAGSGSPASQARLGRGAAENLRRFMAGEPLRDQVFP